MTPSQLRGVPWSLAFLAVILAIIVLVQGERHDRLALASALSTGLVLAVVVTAWEVGRRRTEQALAGELESQRVEAADRKRRAIQRTLTLFIGHALSNIASQVQLVGVDENGEPIELFLDISQALRAFETHKGTERVMAQVGLVTASEKYPPQSLVLNAWTQ